MSLDHKTYLEIIEKTTLTSIDLIIVYDNNILLGYRNNNPARDFWFVPGCRTYKNETLMQGVQRVALSELGITIDINKLKLLGVYDHIYNNNFDNNDFGTHYVVTAYMIILDKKPIINIDGQHEKIAWIPINKVKLNDNIHQYTKNYINSILEIL